MASLKRMIMPSGLAAFVGAMAFAVPADAAVKAECVVDGEAKAETTKKTPHKYVLMWGGKGTFTFDGLNIICIDLSSSKNTRHHPHGPGQRVRHLQKLGRHQRPLGQHAVR